MTVTYDWNWNKLFGCCCWTSGCCCWGSSTDEVKDKLLLSTLDVGNDWKLRFEGSCDPNLNNVDDGVAVLKEGITGLLFVAAALAPLKLNGLLDAPKLKPTIAGLSNGGCGSLFGLAPNVNKELVPIDPLLLLLVFVPMKLKLVGIELEPKMDDGGVGFALIVMFELPNENNVFDVDWPTLPAAVLDVVAVPGWAKLIVILGIGGPGSIFGTVIGDPNFRSLPNRVDVGVVVVVEVTEVHAPPNVNDDEGIELVEVSTILIWW